jgi:L-lactate dehydrogenase complex protein LldG
MTGRDDAKAAVLGRIREALATAPHVVVPRDYDCESLGGAGDVERFAETIGEYQAQVLRIDAASVAATIASLIPSHNGRPTAP